MESCRADFKSVSVLILIISVLLLQGEVECRGGRGGGGRGGGRSGGRGGSRGFSGGAGGSYRSTSSSSGSGLGKNGLYLLIIPGVGLLIGLLFCCYKCFVRFDVDEEGQPKNRNIRAGYVLNAHAQPNNYFNQGFQLQETKIPNTQFQTTEVQRNKFPVSKSHMVPVHSKLSKGKAGQQRMNGRLPVKKKPEIFFL